MPAAEKVDIFFKWRMVHQDADDNKFVDCALNGQADFLVTDDKHFNVFEKSWFSTGKGYQNCGFFRHD